MNMKMMSLVKLLYMIVLFYDAAADIYFHNPRGSNNRLDETSRNVRRNNRMFNSQNNNRGGYNVGGLYYYAGSNLQIEWTNQHSCGGPNNNCEIIIQYMCGDLVRDGTTTNQIPTDNAKCGNNDCNNDYEYGMHEEREYYLDCSRRLRNNGLFLADQNLRGRNRKYAKNTRQNSNGKRYGYECQEERDYYPYWHPTPWMDIAVLSNDASRCEDYKKESQNVKSRWQCVINTVPDSGKTTDTLYKEVDIPNTEDSCTKFDKQGYSAVWTEIPAHGIPAPDCREAPYSRDNHNGNGIGGHPNVYNWTVPDNVHDNCVLRIRYNISTTDYDGWNTFATTEVDLTNEYGFDNDADAEGRGYEFQNNPTVEMFKDIPNFDLQLAINTAQFGRTFQDRSYTFGIKARPAETVGRPIYNLNARGKRGNIVETYPSVEYDFAPMCIEAAVDDYIHIQWTGSNTNPSGNNGNGQRGTDRHNIVLLNNSTYHADIPFTTQPPLYGSLSVNYAMSLKEEVFLGLSLTDGKQLAFSGNPYGDTADLDNAGPYYDLGYRKLEHEGTYNYMCTRNNDFTNRDQKGCVIVRPYTIIWETIGKMGGKITTADGFEIVDVKEGTFTSLKALSLKVMSPTDFKNEIKADGGSLNFDDEDFASHVYCLSPSTLKEGNGNLAISLPLHDNVDLNNVAVYASALDNMSNVSEIDGANIAAASANFNRDDGGCFFVGKKSEKRRKTLKERKTLRELLNILRRKYITK